MAKIALGKNSGVIGQPKSETRSRGLSSLIKGNFLVIPLTKFPLKKLSPIKSLSLRILVKINSWRAKR